jgi:hypothetical protein
MNSPSKKKSLKAKGTPKVQSATAGTTAKGQSIIGPLNIVSDQDIQGGYLELGPNLPEGETPFIDFHRGNVSGEDFNARLINSQNRRLDFITRLDGTVLSLNAGNVGIGTTNTPAAKLEVNGDIKATELRSGSLRVAGVANLDGNLNVTGATDLKANTHVAGELRVDKSGFFAGNVGIGTTNPPADIGNGSLKHSLELRGWILARGDGENTWGDNSARIGVAAPNAAQDKAWYISANPDNKFAIHQAGIDDRLTVDTKGNVGIGTKDPQAKLDVAGDIRVNGKKLAPVHRLWHPGIGDHYYTASEQGKNDAITKHGYTYEGIEFFAFA